MRLPAVNNCTSDRNDMYLHSVTPSWRNCIPLLRALSASRCSYS